ncbi:ALQxL family class IV lanthipeptide [Streptosporangium amethystogenes subsp. fukuiense]|uniref:ALQxL family class IV lanthipeptide n=1 Tax=Streptosporangium amethystogenes subsp. fukuiense TaxID=698418 RepID=A0ABW2THF0_9ACTN
MELDIQALDMLPAQAESSLMPCLGVTCLKWSCLTDITTITTGL